jgi:hypothetical protein
MEVHGLEGAGERLVAALSRLRVRASIRGSTTAEEQTPEGKHH